MFEQVQVTKTLNAECDKVWAAISGIGGLERWFPVIAACRVTAAGVGALREMALHDGGRIVDRVEAIDHAQRCFQYRRIEHPFPVSDYLGTVTVRDVGDGKTELSWTVDADLHADIAPADRGNFLGFVRSALSDGIDGIERDLQ